MKNSSWLTLLISISINVLCQDRTNEFPFKINPSLVAIQISNIDSSEKWYKDNLGFIVEDKKEFPNSGIKVSRLKIEGFDLELVENEKSISRNEILKKYPKGSEIQGFVKLTFITNNIDEADIYLKKNGVKYLFDLQKSNRLSKENHKWLIISDPDGNWIQLISK
jgi:hypothetical protein